MSELNISETAGVLTDSGVHACQTCICKAKLRNKKKAELYTCALSARTYNVTEILQGI